MSDRVSRMRSEILRGSITRSVLKLAWPVAASMMLQTLFGLVDGIWVGHLGPDALAGVSAGGFVIWAIFALIGMVAVGVSALVAQAIGAGDDERAARISGQGLMLAVIAGVTLSVLCLLALDYLFLFMQTDADVTAQGKAYLGTTLYGLPLLFAFANVTSTFSGSGDTQSTMRLSIAAVLIALVLDPVLIYGLGPVPMFGVRGAALATIISRAIMLGVGLWMLANRKTGVGISLPGFAVDLPTWSRIVRIGAPTSANGIAGSLVYVWLTRITTNFGTPAVAALGACHRLEGLSYLLGVGFAAAASAYVGQNIGARQPDRAERGAWRACFLVAVPIGVLAALFMTIPHYLLMAFTSDPAVIEAGVLYLRIVSISMIFQGADLVFEGAFGGAGNTVPPMLVGVPMALVRYPLALLFTAHLGIGVAGVWLAISLTSVVRGIAVPFWFSRGTWRRRVPAIETLGADMPGQ